MRTPFLTLLLLAACGGDDSGNATAADTGPGGSGDTAVPTDTGTVDDSTAATDGSGDDTAEAVDSTTPADTTADTTPVFDNPDPTCVGDNDPGSISAFVPSFGKSEGIAFGPDGNLYVSGQGALWRVNAAAEVTRVADLTVPLGLAPGTDGIWAALQGSSMAPEEVDGGLAFVHLDGTVDLRSTTIPSGNGVLPLRDGTVLVTDDFARNIYRVSPAAEGSAWDTADFSTAIGSPNGLGYSPDGTHIYVVSTFTPKGELTELAVDAAGVPQMESARVVAELGGPATPDGMAVDSRGRVYVAANIQGRIVRVDPDTGDMVNVARGLATPASLAFGRGEGFDPCSIYLTSLGGPAITRVVLDTPGALITPQP